MTNYEKYKDWFDEHRDELLSGEKSLAIVNGKPCFCNLRVICGNCKFNNTDGKSCADQRKEWLNAEYVIDWSKVPIDTKVVVCMNAHAYFAGVENGIPMVFHNGRTSFTGHAKCGVNPEDLRLYEE